MVSYEELYYDLFRSLTKAIEAAQNLNFGICQEILIRAQQDAEERYITAENDEKYHCVK